VKTYNRRRETTGFQGLERERERARELFDIDIDRSFGDWMEQLGWDPDRRSIELVDGVVGVPEFELSERERQVLALTAAGYQKPEISELLHLSLETVKSHHKHVREKMGCSTMQHAVTMGILVGELDTELLREHLFRFWEGR